MQLEELVVVLRANTDQLRRGVDGAMRDVRKSVGNVGASMQQLGGTMQSLGRRMTLLTGIAVGLGAALAKDVITIAMNAESAFDRFSAVFEEATPGMIDFLDDLRTRSPIARHELTRLAGSFGDLLSPMLRNEQMTVDYTQKFMDLANVLAVFSDEAEVEDALEAISSGLRGMSRPLTGFAVDASDAALQDFALRTGLMETGDTFQNLNPQVAKAVRTQALYGKIVEDSAKAIDGFEENLDSARTRQLELNASFAETKKRLGDALLPIYDQVLKKIIPIITKVGDWIEENEKLINQVVTELLQAIRVLVYWLKDEILPVVIDIIRNIRNWARENPELAKQVVKVAGAAALLLVALGPLLMVLGAVFSLIGGFLASGAFAVLVGKIALVVGAVTGLILVGKELYNTWKQVIQITISIIRMGFDNIRMRVRNFVNEIAHQFNRIKDSMQAMNPFARQSPSLVDNVKRGVREIAGEYRKLEGINLTPVANVAMAGSEDFRTNTSKGPVSITNNFAQTEMDVDALSRKLNFQMQTI